MLIIRQTDEVEELGSPQIHLPGKRTKAKYSPWHFHLMKNVTAFLEEKMIY